MLQKFETRITNLVADPNDSDVLRSQKTLLIVAAFLINACATSVYGLAYLLVHEPLAGAAYFAVAAIALVSFALVGAKRLSYLSFSRTQVALGLLSPFAQALILGGFVQSSGVMLFGLNASLGALILFGSRSARRWFLAYLILLGLSIFLQPYLRSTNNLPSDFVAFFFGINIVGVSISVFGELSYYVNQLDLTTRLLRAEQEKSDQLLLNILPKDIAAILKSEHRTIADYFSGVSILFADVVNFTPMSAVMKPIELVELLNEVFSFFDSLVEKYALEKIKTIGDCYMVAAGVPHQRPDHAHVLTSLALEIRDYTSQREFRGKRITFRIGLNSGPVVAGVIGRRKFIYDLWGDAVNTASRMESHGAGGFIQITETTYELIKDDFICEPRGVVNVKGKGDMRVWYVLQKKT